MHADYMACIHNTLTYAMLWTRHTQCNDRTCDNMDYMAYTMQDGLNQDGWTSAAPKSVAKHDEIKSRNTHANMPDARGRTKGIKCHSTKAWQGVKYSKQSYIFQLWNDMQDDPESCKHFIQCMLDGPNTETSEAHYTRGMQSNAQMTKPAPNTPYAVPKQWENGLKWWLKMHGNEAHVMVQKWGIHA